MAAVNKPDRFVDQLDADRAAHEFLEAVHKKWSAEMPGVSIQTIVDNTRDGRTWAVWGHGEQVLLALAVVLRDGMNYSLLVTREFRGTDLVK